MRRGVLHTLAAYLLWGLFPFYFRALNTVPADEIIAHRIVWCVLFVALILACQRDWGWIHKVVTQPKVLGIFTVSAILVATNWGIYVYAIVTDQTVEASLGYFINPLVSVALGAVFLRERLRKAQWIAIFLAFVGVAWLTIQTHTVPMIAVGLALSFGLYGLVRKMAPLGSLQGLALETTILLPAALLYMWYLSGQGTFLFPGASTQIQLLLLAAGPITAVPLLFFAAGVRLIPYSTAGVIQYLCPTMVFLIGIFCFEEPFTLMKLLSFLFIWAGVILFTIDSFRGSKKERPKAP